MEVLWDWDLGLESEVLQQKSKAGGASPPPLPVGDPKCPFLPMSHLLPLRMHPCFLPWSPPPWCCSRGPERHIREPKVVVEVGLRPHSGSPDAALPTPTGNPCPLFHHPTLPKPPRTSLAIFRTTAKQERQIAEKCIPYDWHRFCKSNKNMCDKPACAISIRKAAS